MKNFKRMLVKQDRLVAGIACGFLVVIASHSESQITRLAIGILGGMLINELINFRKEKGK
jgi:hypothetical protein